jgi:sporulation protein YlmC with PRC-barrel domain
MYLFRDILDQQLIDRNGEPLGRVDGIVFETREGSPPRVLQLTMGAVPLAGRFGQRVQRVVEALHRRWSVRRSATYGIPWNSIQEVHAQHLRVDVNVNDTPAGDWERWLRRRVIGRIPGSGKDEE